jgi:hypothetical protein
VPGDAAEQYLLVACTSLLTCYFLGDRSLDSFRKFVFADLGDGRTVLWKPPVLLVHHDDRAAAMRRA